MAFRFAVTFALFSMVMSIAVPVEHHHHDDSPAEYEFSYAVNDHSTGDIKSHQESRKGHAVTGKYELIDSDGYRRIVEYTADEHTGFNAVVKREPTDIKIPVYVAKESHYSHAPQQQHHYSHVPQQHHYSHVPQQQQQQQHHYSHAPPQQHHYTHEPAHHSYEPVQHSHEPAHYYSHTAGLSEHKVVPVQQPYVAPKVAKKILKPIVQETTIEVTEPSTEPKHEEEQVLEVKYVAPAPKVETKVAEHLNEHQVLNTHVSYNAPEFNYHY